MVAIPPDRDMGEVGRVAARMLLNRLTGFVGPPRRLMLSSTVVLGRSVASPAILLPS